MNLKICGMKDAYSRKVEFKKYAQQCYDTENLMDRRKHTSHFDIFLSSIAFRGYLLTTQ